MRRCNKKKTVIIADPLLICFWNGARDPLVTGERAHPNFRSAESAGRKLQTRSDCGERRYGWKCFSVGNAPVPIMGPRRASLRDETLHYFDDFGCDMR